MTTVISELPKHRRPREKLVLLGAQGLTDTELLMVMLGSGTRKSPVRSLARAIAKNLKRNPRKQTLESMLTIKGIGLAKASAVLSAFELARRHFDAGAVKIRQPKDILPLVHHLKERTQEHFVVISLNGNHEVIQTRVVTIGLANFCQIHPREVFADVLLDRATSVIVAHNHPSGSLEPSEEDRAVTVRLCESARILGIKLLDHVVFSRSGYRSLRDMTPQLFDCSRM